MMENIQVAGERVVETVKNLVKEGNVRRITLKNKAGDTVFTMPLTIGVVGVAIAPMLAAIGAVASLMTDCTLSVERDDEPAS